MTIGGKLHCADGYEDEKGRQEETQPHAVFKDVGRACRAALATRTTNAFS